MYVDTHELEQNIVQFDITIDPEDYLSSVNSELKRIKKTASLKGFRPGMVPLSHIANIYGNAILQNEITKLLDGMLKEAMGNYTNIIANQAIPLASAPKIRWSTPQSYTLSFQIGITPSTIKHYVFDPEFPPIKWLKVIPTDEQIDTYIGDLLMKKATVVEIENEPAQEKDVLNGIWFYEPNFGETEREAFHSESTFSMVDLKKGEWYNRLSEMKVGDVLENVTISELSDLELRDILKHIICTTQYDYYDADAFLEKFPTLHFKLTKISRPILPELDEDFFRNCGSSATTIEEFRAEMGEKAVMQKQIPANLLFAYHAKKALIDTTPLELPESYLKRLLNMLHVRGEKEPLTDQQIDEIYPRFYRDLVWEMSLSNFIQKNNIQVSENDLITAISFQLQRKAIMELGISLSIELFLNRAQYLLKNPKEREFAMEHALNDKFLSYLVKTISQEVQNLPLDEFEATLNKETEKLNTVDDPVIIPHLFAILLSNKKNTPPIKQPAKEDSNEQNNTPVNEQEADSESADK